MTTIALLSAFATSAAEANAAGATQVAVPHDAGPGIAKTVRYLGYRFSVPRRWPVIDDTRHRSGCVRFDRHAVYLGPVSSEQSCPSGLLGTTESILVQPGPANGPVVSTQNPVDRQVTVRAPRILLTATFGADQAVIYQILASAGLPVAALR